MSIKLSKMGLIFLVLIIGFYWLKNRNPVEKERGKCFATIKEICPGTKPGSKAEEICLRNKKNLVNIDCMQVVDEILDQQACNIEREKYCSKAGNKEEQIRDCLWEHEEKLSDDCKRAEIALIQAKQCSMDIKKYCKDVKRGEGRLGNCLYIHKKDLSRECAKYEIRLEKYRGEYTIDGLGCKADEDKYCADVIPGKGRGKACLWEHVSELSSDCKQYQIKLILENECREEVLKHCADINNNNRRLAICLMKNKRELSEECAKHEMRLERYWKESTVNSIDCDFEQENFCSNVKEGGGRIKECLLEHVNELSPECKEYQMKLILRDNCHEETLKYCDKEKSDRRRIVSCIIKNKKLLSENCKKNEIKLEKYSAKES